MDWRMRFEAFKSSGYRDPEEMMDKISTASEQDVGLIGRNGTSGIFIDKTGAINLFVKEGVGIKIDPTMNSISIYGSKLNVYASEIDTYSMPLQFKWNKFPLNLKPIAAPGEGTLLPYNTAPTDVAKYIDKLLKGVALGG